jgi:hypothetical protein
MIGMVAGRDVPVNIEDPQAQDADEAARRLARALDPLVIDSLLADAHAAGTTIDGVDG